MLKKVFGKVFCAFFRTDAVLIFKLRFILSNNINYQQMIKTKLVQLLKCPKCMKGTLVISPEREELVCEECSANFPVINDIPQLLPYQSKTDLPESEIHQQYGTKFDYIDHYQKDALVYDYFAERDSVTEHSDRRLREYVASHITREQRIILDVGCGNAWVARMFCRKGYDVVSIDISNENTSEALKKYPLENHSAVVADVYSLPFKNNSFDYIIASEIIEHVASPDLFIAALFKVLAPGGTLIITTPYKEKLKYSLCIHCNKPTPHNAHLHSFDEVILKSLYSGKDMKSFHFEFFNNKVLAFLHMHIILKYCPFKIWKIIDRLMNLIYNPPLRILGKWEKRI